MKSPLEKRVNRFLNKIVIKDKEDNLIVNWRVINKLKRSEHQCCIKAYDMSIDYLIKKNVLSPDKGFDLFMFYDVPMNVFGNLYFTKQEYAQQYKDNIYSGPGIRIMSIQA